MSPENLGTGLSIEGSVRLSAKASTADERKNFESNLHETLFHSKSISVTVTNETSDTGEHFFIVQLKTQQTLAPNYNEMI